MAKKKDMNIKVMADQVMYTNISKSKDGYNSARMVVKAGEKEYMSINYEWEGEGVPDFAMSLMGFMQANEMEIGTEYEGGAKDYPKKDKKEKKGKKGKEKMCADCGNPMSECTC